MVANQSLGSLSEPAQLEKPLAAQASALTSFAYATRRNSHSDDPCQSFHSNRYNDDDGHQAIGLGQESTMSQPSSLPSSTSLPTATAAAAISNDAKKLHKHHKYQQQEVVLVDGPSQRCDRHAAAHHPRASRLSATGRARKEEVVETNSPPPPPPSSSFRAVGGSESGEVRGHRRQQRRKQLDPIQVEQEGYVFEKKMAQKSRRTGQSSKSSSSRREQDGGLLPAEGESSVDARAPTSTVTPRRAMMTPSLNEEVDEREQQLGRDQVESQQQPLQQHEQTRVNDGSAVPPSSSPHRHRRPLSSSSLKEEEEHPSPLLNSISSFSSSSFSSSSSSSSPSSPILSPISSSISPSMSFSLSTPSSPSLSPSFHLPSPTSTFSSSQYNLSDQHQPSSTESSLHSQQQQQSPSYFPIMPSSSWVSQEDQNSQLPQSPSPKAETRPLPPSSPSSPAVVAVEEVRRGKRHSLSLRKPSRTKSLLAFVGRSRTNTAPQASSTTCTEQSSVSAKNLLHHHHHASKPSVQHSELTSSSSPQFPSPQQLPDTRDLTASLAPQPQHQPHKASTRHRHQHSHSHSHSHSPSSPPLHHHHHNNNNHSSTPQSAIPDDLRIHHSRSISMFSSPAGDVASPTTQASTAATGNITVPTSSQSSPARHSVVFPLDASARTHRSGTGPRQMDFDMLQQQRLRQAAATIFASTQAVAAAAAAAAASQQGVRRGRSPSLSSLSSRCASSSSSVIASSSTTTTNTASPPTGVVADPWRDQWLGPSGAMQSLFRDRPSKFNCPHCGATKVRSTIEFVPGMMSFLVSFGLLFLTVGTLSFLPFRKDHKATKDCVHWCPRCETRVARFIRASGTWEWM